MAKSITLVSPDGKIERVVTTPVRETTLKFQGWTVKEGSDVQSLAAKKGPAEKTPVTASDVSTSEPTEAKASANPKK